MQYPKYSVCSQHDLEAADTFEVYGRLLSSYVYYLHFQTTDPSIPFHQRRKTSISASYIKFLVAAEPADSLVQKQVKYLKQTLDTFVYFYLLLSSNKKDLQA